MPPHPPIHQYSPKPEMMPTSVQRKVDRSEAVDRLVAMQQQEGSYSRCDYLGKTTDALVGNKLNEGHMHACCLTELLLQAGSDVMSQRNPVDEECRRKMCVWYYQVTDSLKLNRETVYIAVSYLDRFLATEKGQTFLRRRLDYQLAAITALYIAIKTHETLQLGLTLVVRLGRNCFTKAQIANMETTLLTALKWRLNPPSPLAFIRLLFSFFPDTVDPDLKKSLLDIARFQSELSVFDYSLVKERASSIAVACILNAIHAEEEVCSAPSLRSSRMAFLLALWRQTGMSGQANEVIECRERLLAGLVKNDALVKHEKTSLQFECQPHELKAVGFTLTRGVSPVSVT